MLSTSENEEVSQYCFVFDVVNFELDDGWPASEKDVFQAALRMVVVKNSRWIVGEFYIWAMERYGVKSKID